MNTNQCSLTGPTGISENPSQTNGWFASIQPIFAYAARKAQQLSLQRQLAALPDDILLDIGIDPRTVPHATADIIPRPDLALSNLSAPTWRTTARS